MEINTLTKQEYNEDIVNTQLREIFEPGKYIAPKQNDYFNGIKTHLQEIIENIISPKEISFEQQLNDKFLELDFGSEFNIDATKIGVQDAVFFVNILNQENLLNYTVQDDSLNITTFDNKKINATNSLLNMLKTSFDTKKPIRLDFDNDVTVILRLDKEGKIQAHFIPGTSEVEAYLKNNISCLKQAFDEEEINYSHLGYSKHKENNENKNKKRSKK
ncbi:MAG: hypothetical protein IJ003_05870 [Candidatus Gastranaerophilales bacterium]|nr:hypothetical protein [Candidatus Gastranaerophilales bacterium]